VCGWQVKLCDPLVTHGSYLSALEVQHDKALYKSTYTLLYRHSKNKAELEPTTYESQVRCPGNSTTTPDTAKTQNSNGL